jgi:hypothetical protein
VGNEQLRLRVPNTGDYGKYTETTVGRVTLASAGIYNLEVRPRRRDWQPVNLRTVKLVPAN